MVKLAKFESPKQIIIKEFVPRDQNVPLSAGRLIIRTLNYGSDLVKFDRFFDIVATDTLTFEPPLELDRKDAQVVHYGGERYSGTFGLEVVIPEGHAIPAEYTRVDQAEFKR